MGFKQRLHAGFTIVEMLIIVPIVILVIGIFISAIVSMTGDILSTRGSNSLSFNIQDALNRIEQDVSLSSGFLATNNVALVAPQGYDDGTAVFDNAGTNGTMLILNAYATTGNPQSSTPNTIYTQSPNPCGSAQVNQNPPVMVNIIYFVKGGTLWRRVVVPYNYSTVGCSIPWQQPTCTPGFTTPSFCKTQDTRLVDGIQANGFNVNYYASASSLSADTTASDGNQTDGVRQAALQAVNTVGVTINAASTLAGRNVSQSGTTRATSPNNPVQPIVTNGLILNLDAGNPASYSGSGTTWNDISGNGNNGVINGGTTYSSANGGALSFNGSNSYVSITNNPQLQITGSSTIEFWIKPTNLAAGRQNIIDKTYGGEFAFTQEPTGTMSYFYGTSGVLALPYQGFSTSPVAATQGQWQHFALVRNLTNSTLYWYRNGVLVNSVAASYTAATASSNNITIGLGYTGVYYNGLISCAHIYNRALSAPEIQQNFNALGGRYNYQNVKALVVAGGGGGGNDVNGGGGGGGVVYDNSVGLLAQSYIVTVGNGGAPGAAVGSNGSNGGNSSFSSIIAYGGGGGGGNGASGGGGSTYTPGYSGGIASPAGQGNNGGNGYVGSSRYYNGGGGGGSSNVGQAATTTKAGDGGIGLSYSIGGSPQVYASGGGGGWLDTGGTGSIANRGTGGANAGSGGINNNTTVVLPATSATANFGGGGGGGGWQTGANNAGGSGGSGVVIISYPTGTMSATGGTITTSSGYTIHTFTSSGTFTVN